MARVAKFPRRVFSARAATDSRRRGVFACYRLPGRDLDGKWETSGPASRVEWYFFQAESSFIVTDLQTIHEWITCEADTPRVMNSPTNQLLEIRRRIEDHIRETYFKKIDAPMGAKPVLLAWLEMV